MLSKSYNRTKDKNRERKREREKNRVNTWNIHKCDLNLYKNLEFISFIYIIGKNYITLLSQVI